MRNDTSPTVLEILVFHSLRLTTDAWYAIADRYDCFLNFNFQTEGNAETWYQPFLGHKNATSNDAVCIDERVHRLLAKPLPHHISTRVDRYQHANQFNLNAFATVGRLRLTARSYTLAINRHKQCMLIFRFAFTPGNNEQLDEAELAEEIEKISEDRQIYRNISQLDYTEKAKRDAINEICRNFSENFTNYRSQSQIVLGNEDFAFPIFVCGAVDPKVAAIFNKEERAIFNTSTMVYFGWNYGLVCGQDNNVVNDSLAMFVFMQFSYHNLRQYEGFLDREMERTSLRSKAIDTDRAASIVGNLTHTFEWFHLDFFRHIGTLNPRIHAIADELLERWRLRHSITRMHTSLTYHRDYVTDEFARAAQRDTKRQEAILFLIALLQLFALVSVLVDFQTLHGITQNAQKLLDPGLVGWEWWGLKHVDIIPRILLLLSIILGAVFYGPILVRRSKRLVANGWTALSRTVSNTVKKLSLATRFAHKRLIVRPSSMHGLGIFPLFGFSTGETLLYIHAGTATQVLSEEEQKHEWNYHQGTYYIRSQRTPYGYINHSRTPNAKCMIHIEGDSAMLEIVVTRNISRYEEILLDYREEDLPSEYIRDSGGYL